MATIRLSFVSQKREVQVKCETARLRRQVRNRKCLSILYRQSHVAALSLAFAFECTLSRVGLVQRQRCTVTSIPSSTSTVPNVWSSYSSASLAQARCVRHFSRVVRVVSVFARYDDPHSAPFIHKRQRQRPHMNAHFASRARHS